jgi:hypothetical protein
MIVITTVINQDGAVGLHNDTNLQPKWLLIQKSQEH